MEDQTQLIDLDKPVQNNDLTEESVPSTAISTNKLFKSCSAKGSTSPFKEPELSTADKVCEGQEIDSKTEENNSCGPPEN